MKLINYQLTEISTSIRENFKPTRLCIKKCASMYYFCKSTRKNIHHYTGSGVAWKALVKKHGKNNVVTLWVSDWYYDPQEIQEIAIHFSRENDIVGSKKWANLVPEWGLDFTTRKGMRDSDETKKRKSIARTGVGNPMTGLTGELSPHYGKKRTIETRKKQSNGLKKYSKNRPQSHNENISRSLRGNPNLIKRVTGHNNGSFKGYWVTSSGEIFDSSRKAAAHAGGLDKKTLMSWARAGKNNWYFVPKENFCLLA